MIPVGVPDVAPTLTKVGTGVSHTGHNEDGWYITTSQTPAYGIPGNWIGRKPENGGNAVEPMHDVAPCLTKTDQHGVAQAIPIDSMNHLGRNNAEHSLGDFVPGAPSYTLTKQHSHAVAQPISFTRCDHGGDAVVDGTPTMRCGSNYSAHLAVAQPVNIYGGNKRQDRPEGGFYVRLDEDTSKTLDAATGLNPTCSQGGTAVLQPTIVHGTQDPCVSDIAFAQGRNNGGENVLVQPVGTDLYNCSITGDVSMTLKRGDGNPAINQPTVMQHMAVRRLLPVECERLQGFPDHYTDIKPKGKPTPDGPRYKALGNSWAVPVVRWIGERIMMVEGLK